MPPCNHRHNYGCFFFDEDELLGLIVLALATGFIVFVAWLRGVHDAYSVRQEIIGSFGIALLLSGERPLFTVAGLPVGLTTEPHHSNTASLCNNRAKPADAA